MENFLHRKKFSNSITKFFFSLLTAVMRKEKKKKILYTKTKRLYGIGKNKNDEII